MQATDLVEVPETHRVVFMWRDGELRTDSAFLAYLFHELEDGALYPLFEMHCHPSHKGVHAKLPCNAESNFASRVLPGAPELALSGPDDIDPRIDADRQVLVALFCKAWGIGIGAAGGLWN